MEKVLAGLQPEAVFKNFEALTRIPRESGNEKGVSDYLVSFAKNLGLEVIQEPCMNVIIKKPATAGYENLPTVILQGHMDMVCVKESGLAFDFEKDSIPVAVKGDHVCTQGTSLGADNGIAVAMSMAILESDDLPHPPLEVLVTVAEETGMDGVLNLNPENLSGDILINLDSEEEGVFLTSCAGGVRNLIKRQMTFEAANADMKPYALKVSGLSGGHSGIEINKGRANAIKLLGSLVESAVKGFGAQVSAVSGGEKMNAIPKRSEAVLWVTDSEAANLSKHVEGMLESFRAEYGDAEPTMEIKLEACSDCGTQVFDAASTAAFIELIKGIPTGVQTMCADIEGLVESSNNIGVLTMKADILSIDSAVRSSVKALKDGINERIKILCDANGAEMDLIADYPAWPYNPVSPIRDLMLKVYEEKFGKPAEVSAIHAGLECGFLKEKVGEMDMISLGPNMWDVHTPQEHLSIESTERVYSLLCDVLKNVNTL